MEVRTRLLTVAEAKSDSPTCSVVLLVKIERSHGRMKEEVASLAGITLYVRPFSLLAIEVIVLAQVFHL